MLRLSLVISSRFKPQCVTTDPLYACQSRRLVNINISRLEVRISSWIFIVSLVYLFSLQGGT